MNYAKLSKEELQNEAIRRGIDLGDKTTKATIIEKLKASDEKSTYENVAPVDGAIDPAGELFNETKDALKTEGYDVKILDLEKSTGENERKNSSPGNSMMQAINASNKREISPSLTRRSRSRSITPRPKTLRNTSGVITINGSDRFKHEVTPEEQLVKDIEASMDPNIKLVLNGTILGYRTLNAGGESYVVITVAYKDRTAYIPPEKFFPNYSSIPKESLRAYISMRLNTPCEFIVYEKDPDFPATGSYVLASRLMALQKKMSMWNSRVEERDEDGKQENFLKPEA